MSEAWNRLITEMIRCMIRQFLAHPGELLTFKKLASLIGSDHDVLQAIAHTRDDLFLITADDRFVKLFPDAVERIVAIGVESAIADVRPRPIKVGTTRECHPTRLRR